MEAGWPRCQRWAGRVAGATVIAGSYPICVLCTTMPLLPGHIGTGLIIFDLEMSLYGDSVAPAPRPIVSIVVLMNT